MNLKFTLGHKDVYYVGGTVRGTAVGEIKNVQIHRIREDILICINL